MIATQMPQVTFSLRKNIMLVIATVRYVFCILGMIGRFPLDISVGGGALVLWAFFLCMTFFFWTFVCIDMQRVSTKTMVVMMLTLFILSTLLFGGDQLFLGRLQKLSNTSGLGSVLQGNLASAKWRVIGSLLLHASLFYRRLVKKDSLTNTRKISLWTYVREGSSILAILNAATLASFVLVQFQQLPFSCEYLAEKSYVGIQALQNLAGYVGLGADDKDTVTTSTGSSTTIEADTKTQSLSGRLAARKAALIDQIVADRKVVNQGICSYILTAIIEKYQNPAFQYSVAVLLMVLLTPFLSLLWFTLDIVNILLLRGLQLMGIYRREESLQIVEEIN